jgi:hypothetical protein
MAFNNNLITSSRQVEVDIFRLELLIDSETKQVTYNQDLIPGKVTQSASGIVSVYDPHRECNVQIVCNNRDIIERKVIDNGEYIKYSINCSKARIAEFKEALVRYARAKEAELLTAYQKAVETKTELIAQIDAYLGAKDEDNTTHSGGTSTDQEQLPEGSGTTTTS